MKLLVVLALFLSACTQCKSGATRCSGSRAQLCAPDGRWRTVVDCNKLYRTTKKFKCSCDKKCGCYEVK